jgi:hypothetical protein
LVADPSSKPANTLEPVSQQLLSITIVYLLEAGAQNLFSLPSPRGPGG